MRIKILLAAGLMAIITLMAAGQPGDSASGGPMPVSELRAEDVPNDAGGAINLNWTPSVDDSKQAYYKIFRSEDINGPFIQIAEIISGISEYLDQGLEANKHYFYRVDIITEIGTATSGVAGPVTPKASLFNTQRGNLLIALAAFTGLVLFFIWRARKGASLFVRKITGLSAVDEAIGRATEMGRPILYLPSGGLSAVSDIQTLASLVILGRVAEKAAEYETPLLVPCSDPLVMTLAQEIVKASYMNAGRPDAYRAENIRYLTNEQFAYTAGVDGIMIREKPAANFMIGTFYAESLILAETGYATGAIQIAGTAMITQLPFFVAACDYTLIGEEIYAASAYLSKEPVLMGTIKAQDWGKGIAIGLIIIGVVLETLALKFPKLHIFVSQWLSSQ